MNKDVELRAYSGAGVAYTLQRFSNGTDLTESGYHYTVQKYIQTVVKNSDNYPASLVSLMKAMSDYGSKAQYAIGYDTDVAAAIYDEASISAVTLDTLLPFKRVLTKTDRTGIQYVSLNLTLESETTSRVFFIVNDGVIGDYSFRINGKTVTPKSTTNGYAIEVTNIAAKELDTLYRIEVSDSQGVCLTVESGALSYAYLLLKNASNQTPEWVALVKALYVYNQAANAYFE
jgi:hypothetical protein